MKPSWTRSFVNGNPQVRETLHGKITPAEVRIGEPIKAKLFYGEKQVEMRVWRISPLGIELVMPTEHSDLNLGNFVDLELTIGVGNSRLSGVVVTTIHEESGINILGIRLCQPSIEKWSENERRSQKRWVCSPEFMPTGVAPTPGKFNDFVFFRTLDVSGSGMTIVTSLRNKYLVPGMKMQCTLSLPMVGQVNCTFEILNARFIDENGKEGLALGGKFINPDERLKSSIGEYVFQFGPTSSITELKTNGLIVREIGKGLEFRYVKTKEDYEQVLELRKIAYGGAGKLAPNSEVGDIFDSRSRIVIGVYRGKVIASMRLIYNEVEDKMEHEQFVEFPVDFPRRDEICEITRVCTHPEYRGSDLLLGLFRFAAVTVVQSGRKYVVGCATDELLPFYTKVGFAPTGLTYEHKDLNNIKHHIFITDVAKGLSGSGVNPIVWNIVWKGVSEFVTESNIYEFDSFANVRMGFYKLLTPISQIILKKGKNPKKKNNSLKKATDSSEKAA